MARKSKYKKEDIITTSLQLVREGGMNAVSARNITRRLGATQATIFTHYSSMDEIKAAVVEEVKKIYDSYVERGLAMDLPFKGYGMMTLRFAKDEPQLYRVLFYGDTKVSEIHDLLVSKGHYENIIESVIETFKVTRSQAEEIYLNISLYARGLENLVVNGTVEVDDRRVAELYGNAASAFVNDAKNPRDERFKQIPIDK